MGRAFLLRTYISLFRQSISVSSRNVSTTGYKQVRQAQKPVSSVRPQDFIYQYSYDDGPFAAYKTGRLGGVYRGDPRQEAVVLELQELHDRLNEKSAPVSLYSGLTVVDSIQSRNVQTQKRNWFSGIASLLKSQRPAVQSTSGNARTQSTKDDGRKGLYLHGGVGVGKTMLMDLFVAAKPAHIKVNRVHFHDFMLGIHARLKQESDKQDPLRYVADSISSQTRVLALDELFITDVADAMIINRLFQSLWDNGIVLISTSNRKPEDLYLGGLQRDLFLPFIDNLQTNCVVHNMESVVDYRKLAHSNKGIYFTGKNRNQCLRNVFKTKSLGNPKRAKAHLSLQRGRRRLFVPLAAGPFSYYTFDDICGMPVGAADYLALCHHFHTIFIQDIPRMTRENKSAAYRFVNLIDILYDNRVRLICSVETGIERLFELVITHAESVEKSDGNDEWVVDENLHFAKDRTISRLIEMESMEYKVEHANKHAPELLMALAEMEERHSAAVG